MVFYDKVPRKPIALGEKVCQNSRKNMEEKFIKLTKKKLKTVFEKCNSLYFDNQVPTPKYFELWTPSKRIAGWVRCVWNKTSKSRDAALHISDQFYWTEENLVKTMVHEMIHLLIEDYKRPLSFWRRLLGKDHEQDFKDKMNELNEKYNLDIAIRVKYMKKYMKKKE